MTKPTPHARASLPPSHVLLTVRAGILTCGSRSAPSPFLAGSASLLCRELILLWGVHHIGTIRAADERLVRCRRRPICLFTEPLYSGNSHCGRFARAARSVWLAPVICYCSRRVPRDRSWEKRCWSTLGSASRLPRAYEVDPRSARGQRDRAGQEGFSWVATFFSERGTVSPMALGYRCYCSVSTLNFKSHALSERWIHTETLPRYHEAQIDMAPRLADLHTLFARAVAQPVQPLNRDDDPEIRQAALWRSGNMRNFPRSSARTLLRHEPLVTSSSCSASDASILNRPSTIARRDREGIRPFPAQPPDRRRRVIRANAADRDVMIGKTQRTPKMVSAALVAAAGCRSRDQRAQNDPCAGVRPPADAIDLNRGAEYRSLRISNPACAIPSGSG